MVKQKTLLLGLILLLLMILSVTLHAKNYINWKGNFWLQVPDTWEKVDYRIVDRFLSMAETDPEAFAYQAVFAPSTSSPFISDAYLVINFDSLGQLSDSESDSILNEIVGSYTDDLLDSPVIELMTDLVPGQPKINYSKKVVSVINDMAHQGGVLKKLWLYMRLNDRGLISLYFYSPDSSYQKNKPLFDEIVSSLSFEGLREAAAKGQSNFVTPEVKIAEEIPSIASNTESLEKTEDDLFKSKILYGLIVIVVFGLLWNFVISPLLKKKQTDTD